MNKLIKPFFAFSVLLCITLCKGQDLYLPVNIRAAYEKESRASNGMPGKNYWQNRSDYAMDINFNPSTLLVKGKALITYFNNSPDTLTKIVLRNYPDIFKKDALRDFYVADENEGVAIESIRINDKVLKNEDHALKRNGTLLTVKTNVMPASKTTIEISWSYTLMKASSHLRSGEVTEGACFIGYSYPRIAVYDDLQGWDESQYLGQQEPYFEYGNYSVSITVPAGYVVWATGELKNANEVFQKGVYEKYIQSLSSDSAIYIISEKDLKEKKVTKGSENVFRFEATDVPDFAFATSDKYIWMGGSLIADNKSGRRATVNTVFDPHHNDYYPVNEFARKSVELMGSSMPGIAYPYSHITIFDGLDQMEFPMMVNDNPVSDRKESITLTDHEVFHTLLPFFVGANQTRYAWMDEGWATFSEWIISPGIDSSIKDDFGLFYSLMSSGKEWDAPLILSASEWKRSYMMNAYSKFALVLLYLRDMLGNELFNRCLQDFMYAWKSKHPSPWDFFNAMNTASGQNLNWFWQKWFYDYGETDPSLLSVKQQGDSAEITVFNQYKPVPFNVTVTFKDGAEKKYAYTAAVWQNGNSFVVRTPEWKNIIAVSIHHDYVPDINLNNNIIRLKQH